VKYNLQARKVRDHPLMVVGEEAGAQQDGSAFGGQQKNIFVLDQKKRSEEDEDAEGPEKKDDKSGKVNFIFAIMYIEGSPE